MKHVISILFLFILFSCRKENPAATAGHDTLLSQLKTYVLGHSTLNRYNSIRWADAVPIKKEGRMVGFSILCTRDSAYSRRLIALQQDAGWECRFQYIEGGQTRPGLFNGSITYESLDGTAQQVMTVKDNQTQRLRDFNRGKLVKDSRPEGQDETNLSIHFYAFPPGVVFINGGVYYWVNQTGGWGSNPTPVQPVVSYLNADLEHDDHNGGVSGEIIDAEYHDLLSAPGVSIEKLFNCFDNIPAFPGTTYEISLNSDVPINSIPGAVINFLGSPGHAFITITKRNGNIAVSQSFGFYPNEIGFGNVPSKIVDDGEHEINAQIKIPMTQFEFNSIRANAVYYASLPYNLENNNCTDFALNLFNLARDSNNQILLQKYLVTGINPILNTPFTILVNNAPQTLFLNLKQKKDSNSPDAPNIIINQTHSMHSDESQGECL